MARHPYEQNAAPSKLDKYLQLQEANAQEDAGDVARQNSMVEQLSKLYGIQQQQQLTPEHLQSLQLENRRQAALFGYIPGEHDLTQQTGQARLTGLNTENSANAQKLLYFGPEHDLAQQTGQARLVGLQNENQFYPQTQQADINAKQATTNYTNQETTGLPDTQKAKVLLGRSEAIRQLEGPGFPTPDDVTSATMSGQDPGDIYQIHHQNNIKSQQHAYIQNFDMHPDQVWRNPQQAYEQGLNLQIPKPLLDRYHSNWLQGGTSANPYANAVPPNTTNGASGYMNTKPQINPNSGAGPQY